MLSIGKHGKSSAATNPMFPIKAPHNTRDIRHIYNTHKDCMEV